MPPKKLPDSQKPEGSNRLYGPLAQAFAEMEARLQKIITAKPDNSEFERAKLAIEEKKLNLEERKFAFQDIQLKSGESMAIKVADIGAQSRRQSAYVRSAALLAGVTYGYMKYRESELEAKEKDLEKEKNLFEAESAARARELVSYRTYIKMNGIFLEGAEERLRVLHGGKLPEDYVFFKEKTQEDVNSKKSESLGLKDLNGSVGPMRPK